MRTGPTVQMTLDHRVVARLRRHRIRAGAELEQTTISSTSTKSVIGTMNHSVYCSNQRISCMIGVAAGCSVACHGIGWSANCAGSKKQTDQRGQGCISLLNHLSISLKRLICDKPERRILAILSRFKPQFAIRRNMAKAIVYAAFLRKVQVGCERQSIAEVFHQHTKSRLCRAESALAGHYFGEGPISAAVPRF